MSTSIIGSLGRANFDVDTYAAQTAPAGVQMVANPNEDAPIKHQLLRPTAQVAALVKGRKKFEKITVSLTLEPDHKAQPYVCITGLPSALTLHDDGDTMPTVPFNRFADIALRATGDQMIAAEIEERFGTRIFTLVAVERKRRRYLQFERSLSVLDGTITWTPLARQYWFSGVVLLDAASAAQAVKALRSCLDACEITRAPYYL